MESVAVRVLSEAFIPELPNYYKGKVRENYDLPDGSRIIIATDRISAFDRILAAIPDKGHVLTQTARYWFEKTADICPNHVIAYPDPNVVIGKRLDILPVEIVVRGYLAGTTGTSLLTLYKKGERRMYGLDLPDGMKDNQVLPEPVITPTSKAFDGGHDEPLTPADIIGHGLLTAEQWETVSRYALALFARGQKLAAERASFLSTRNTNSAPTPTATSFSPTRSTRRTAAATGSPKAIRTRSTRARGLQASTRISSAPGSSSVAIPIRTRSRPFPTS